MTFTIPEPRTVAPRKNPQSMLVYGNWKVGKTTACAAIPESVLIELQPGGADFVPHGRIMPVNSCQEFLDVLGWLTEQRKAGKPAAKRLVVDHVGVVDDWCFDLALAAFKRSPMGGGKNADLRRITDLPSGGGTGGSPGWNWYWEELGMMHYRMVAAAEDVIFISHLRDKAIKKDAGEVVVEDVDITGSKGRRLFCGQSSAIGFMFRRLNGAEDQLVLSFKTSDSVIAGCSCQHLTGREFVVGKSTNKGPVTFDWSPIFTPDQP